MRELFHYIGLPTNCTVKPGIIHAQVETSCDLSVHFKRRFTTVIDAIIVKQLCSLIGNIYGAGVYHLRHQTKV